MTWGKLPQRIRKEVRATLGSPLPYSLRGMDWVWKRVSNSTEVLTPVPK